jgi:hypothetical protein
MARVLCVWEQGSNLGHLSHLRAPMEVAQALGHEVTLVVRELHRIPEVMSGLRFGLMQAPFKQSVAIVPAADIQCYAQLLGVQCFSSAQELLLYVRAWRAIFDAQRPDIVFFDHSPTALVAAWAYGFRKALVGYGFSIPRTDFGDGPLQPFPTAEATSGALARLVADDQRVLELINQVHAVQDARPMHRLGDLYAQAPFQALQTWPALDCFGPRTHATYLGMDTLRGKQIPRWPSGVGPKVYGYLSNFPGLERLLLALESQQVCALLLVRDLPEAMRGRFTGGQISFVDSLLDLAQVGQQADWVVHHGNHGISAAFLMAGVPQLAIPLHQEHLLGALRLVEQACALVVFQDQAFDGAVAAMCSRMDLRKAAKGVQTHSKPYDPEDARRYFGETMRGLPA